MRGFLDLAAVPWRSYTLLAIWRCVADARGWVVPGVVDLLMAGALLWGTFGLLRLERRRATPARPLGQIHKARIVAVVAALLLAVAALTVVEKAYGREVTDGAKALLGCFAPIRCRSSDASGGRTAA